MYVFSCSDQLFLNYHFFQTKQYRQCTKAEYVVPTMSMCCGLGGPGAADASTTTMSAAKAGGISAAVLFPIICIAVYLFIYVYVPTWRPKFLRRDTKEETGHAPHREVDLRGRDII